MATAYPGGMKAEIARFLRTGDADPLMAKWPGAHALDRIRRGEEAMTNALLAEVQQHVVHFLRFQAVLLDVLDVSARGRVLDDMRPGHHVSSMIYHHSTLGPGERRTRMA